MQKSGVSLVLDGTAQYGASPLAGPRTLTSAVFRLLRADILSTKLAPGSKIKVSELAARFGVSLGAVREALSRLVADGLVEASDQRGFRVSPLSHEDLQDLTRTRIDIETLALRRAIELGDAAWLASVEAAFADLRREHYYDAADPTLHNEAWVARHSVFHKTLVSACGSAWLLRFRETLYEQSERYRRISVPVDRGERDVDSEHARIVEAVLRRDADAAVAALTDHFEHTRRIAEGRFADR